MDLKQFIKVENMALDMIRSIVTPYLAFFLWVLFKDIIHITLQISRNFQKEVVSYNVFYDSLLR